MTALGMETNIGICDVTCGEFVLNTSESLGLFDGFPEFMEKPTKTVIRTFKMSKYSHISSNHKYRAMNLVHFSGESHSASEQDGVYNIENEEIGQVDW